MVRPDEHVIVRRREERLWDVSRTCLGRVSDVSHGAVRRCEERAGMKQVGAASTGRHLYRSNPARLLTEEATYPFQCAPPLALARSLKSGAERRRRHPQRRLDEESGDVGHAW